MNFESLYLVMYEFVENMFMVLLFIVFLVLPWIFAYALSLSDLYGSDDEKRAWGSIPGLNEKRKKREGFLFRVIGYVLLLFIICFFLVGLLEPTADYSTSFNGLTTP